MHVNTALLGLLSSPVIVSSQETQCHDYVLISIRGTYEVQGPSIGFRDMINNTLNTIPNGIEYDAVYPAAANQTAYLGAEDVVRYIDAGLQSCPDQNYAILGYSQGASAAGIALMNYTEPSNAGYQAIRAVLVIGNPNHRPNASVNVDQNGTDSTRGFGGVFNASRGIPDPWYDNGRLLDICYYGDVVCAPQSTNASFTFHLRYGLDQNVQTMGSDFLIEKLSSNDTSTDTNGTTTDPSSTGNPGGTGSGSSPTSGSASPTPSSPGAASGILPGSLLALVVCIAALLATSGI